MMENTTNGVPSKKMIKGTKNASTAIVFILHPIHPNRSWRSRS